MRYSGRAITVTCAAILAWRVPQLRTSGTQPGELRSFVGRDLPKAFLTPRASDSAEQGAHAYYVYAESCPYCGMDRTKVRNASLRATPAGITFTGVSVGKRVNLEPYWRETGGALPDHLTSVDWRDLEALGLRGVPILFITRGSMVKAAWIGHLRWDEADTRRSIECRLGRKSSCGAIYFLDALRGLADRAVRLMPVLSNTGAAAARDAATSRRI